MQFNEMHDRKDLQSKECGNKEYEMVMIMILTIMTDGEVEMKKS